MAAREKGMSLRAVSSAISYDRCAGRVLRNRSAAPSRTHRRPCAVSAGAWPDGCIEVWDNGMSFRRPGKGACSGNSINWANPERDRGKGLGLGLVRRTARLLGHPLALAFAGRRNRYHVHADRAHRRPRPGRFAWPASRRPIQRAAGVKSRQPALPGRLTTHRTRPGFRPCWGF